MSRHSRWEPQLQWQLVRQQRLEIPRSKWLEQFQVPVLQQVPEQRELVSASRRPLELERLWAGREQEPHELRGTDLGNHHNNEILLLEPERSNSSGIGQNLSCLSAS